MAFPAASYVADLCIVTPVGRRRNRFYYGSDYVPANPAVMEYIANGVFLHFAPVLKEVMSNACKVEKVELKYYGAGGLGLEGVSSKPAVLGNVAYSPEEGMDDDSGVMPDEASLIIRVSTGKVGRSKRGRRFISGLSEAINRNGSIEPVYAPECIAIATKVPQQITVNLSAVDEEAGDMFFDARHYDRKNNVMEVLSKAWALGTIGTRKDRRNPLELSVLVTET